MGARADGLMGAGDEANEEGCCEGQDQEEEACRRTWRRGRAQLPN